MQVVLNIWIIVILGHSKGRSLRGQIVAGRSKYIIIRFTYSIHSHQAYGYPMASPVNRWRPLH